MLQVSEGTDDAATSYLVHLLSDLNTLLKKVSSDELVIRESSYNRML